MKGWWTCRRVAGGKKCGTDNPNRKRLCLACGKPRPPRKKPAHMRALKDPYDVFLALNGGVEKCALCGAGPKTRRLQRDHCHNSGAPRGLLCSRCNRALPRWMTAPWLRAAADYLERTEETP